MKFQSKPRVGIPSGNIRAHIQKAAHKIVLAVMMIAVLALSSFTSYMPAMAAEGDPVLVVAEAPTLKQTGACSDVNAREVSIPQIEGVRYYVFYWQEGLSISAFWLQGDEASPQSMSWSFDESDGPFCVGLEAEALMTTVDLEWKPSIIPAEKCGVPARFSDGPMPRIPTESDIGKLPAYWEADDAVLAEDGSISRTYRVVIGSQAGFGEPERWDAFGVSIATERVHTLTLPDVEPCDVETTPVAPVLIPSVQCGVEATIQIAETEGVAYSQTREGSVVTVTSAAEPGHFLAEGAEKTWALEIPQVEECEVVEPTIEPTPEPTPEPTVEPTIEPTLEPTVEPMIEPTIEPTLEPTVEPMIEPTPESTPEPTVEPTVAPAPDVERVEVHSGNTAGPGVDVLGIAMGGLGMLAALMLGIRILHRRTGKES